MSRSLPSLPRFQTYSSLPPVPPLVAHLHLRRRTTTHRASRAHCSRYPPISWLTPIRNPGPSIRQFTTGTWRIPHLIIHSKQLNHRNSRTQGTTHRLGSLWLFVVI